MSAPTRRRSEREIEAALDEIEADSDLTDLSTGRLYMIILEHADAEAGTEDAKRAERAFALYQQRAGEAAAGVSGRD